MLKQDFDKTIRIPVITDLVRAGDPEIINQTKNPQASKQRQEAFEQRLKERIAELQSTIGQDEYTGLARAHAIRTEGSRPHGNAPDTSKLDHAVEKQIDRARDELVRELSSMLK